MSNASSVSSLSMSALNPAGPHAEAIHDLTFWMTLLFGAVFIFVMLLGGWALFAKRSSDSPRPPLGENRFILVGGVAFPSIVLTVLLIYTLQLTARLQPESDGLLIELTGHMWWWDVKYPEHGIRIANEIIVPAGQTVRIVLESKDVIHSLWVPELAGKMDLVPGQRGEMTLEANKPGVYRGQCAEYCGLQHAHMVLYIRALPPEEFQRWIEERKSPPTLPVGELNEGLQVFRRAGCAECHAIRGTEFNSNVGPDLTHIGSRLSLGSGTLSNSKGGLAGWIADPQSLKPGNKMPRSYMRPEELHKLVDYLMSLK